MDLLNSWSDCLRANLLKLLDLWFEESQFEMQIKKTHGALRRSDSSAQVITTLSRWIRWVAWSHTPCSSAGFRVRAHCFSDKHSPPPSSMHLLNNPSCHHQALEKVAAVEVPGWIGEALLFPWGVCPWPCTPWLCSSVSQRSVQRRREFMKKLETVESSRPSCWEMVICISLEGRRFSLKMATKVRRCRSVKTSRCFFGIWLRSRPRSSSLRLHAGEKKGEA